MTRAEPERRAPAPPTGDDLATWSATELQHFLATAAADTPPNLGRGELLAAAQAALLAQGRDVLTNGALELLPEGFGFLRSPHLDYAPSPHDAFVSPSQVRALNLKPGHFVGGPLRAPRGSERYFALTHIDRVNGAERDPLTARLAFAARQPIVATRPLTLPAELPWQALATLTPWCRGQRILVEAPAAWPRARWLTALAAALRREQAELGAFVCLLDQRPEDLAAAKAAAAGSEVTGTTFDQGPERHEALAAMVLARACREVEAGRDVVLLLDSLTALTHASQRANAASGRWLCAGLDAHAVLAGKRLFAAARACAEGGSLTVIATAIRDSAALADTAVLDEFRHRGNAEVVIDGDADDAMGVPFDPCRTRTRPEDDARDAAARHAVRALRERLAVTPPAERAALFTALRLA